MRDETVEGAMSPEPTMLDGRLLALEAEAPPDDLLERCLATIPSQGRPAPVRPARHARWIIRVAATAAAILLIAVMSTVVQPRPADAGHFLKAMRAAWTEVPAFHCVLQIDATESQKARTKETWFVRGKGRREEIHTEGKLIGVVVNNLRWEYRWDIAGKMVAVWSTTLAGRGARPEDSGLFRENEELLKWAESTHAEIRIEPDSIGDRKVRKVVLSWPGPGGKGDSPQTDEFWLDTDSLRPLRSRTKFATGPQVDTIIDYPAPEGIPIDRFVFRMPADVTLEINDPDLGRQVYSEAKTTIVEKAPRN